MEYWIFLKSMMTTFRYKFNLGIIARHVEAHTQPRMPFVNLVKITWAKRYENGVRLIRFWMVASCKLIHQYKSFRQSTISNGIRISIKSIINKWFKNLKKKWRKRKEKNPGELSSLLASNLSFQENNRISMKT